MLRERSRNAAERRLCSIRRWLRARLSPEKYVHSLSVSVIARSLAFIRAGSAAGDRARLAGLLHDAGYALPAERWETAVRNEGLTWRGSEADIPALRHAALSELLARRVFGVDDPDTLRAIRHHSTGRPGMSVAETAVFAADAVEPGRTYPGVEELRADVFNDLRAGALRVLRNKLRYCRHRRWPVDIRSRKWLAISRVTRA